MLSYDFIEPYRILIDDVTKEMVDKKEIKPEDFKFDSPRLTEMVLKDKPLELVLDKFLDKLKPLEHRCLPVIRKVESML